jgi:hypothetical protein
MEHWCHRTPELLLVYFFYGKFYISFQYEKKGVFSINISGLKTDSLSRVTPLSSRSSWGGLWLKGSLYHGMVFSREVYELKERFSYIM